MKRWAFRAEVAVLAALSLIGLAFWATGLIESILAYV